ncbi:excalibur calcium-binding domain-containing protein [Maricaulis sp.]|uniref:excalibur calcium-binding domain-containing protein n=1 Tax=Maricaulis sp. TaxID=1486257 RepID=UPI003A95C933
MRHYLASEGCYSASTVGLAPARRGEPGYWHKLDGDKDGISCELWTPDGRRAKR